MRAYKVIECLEQNDFETTIVGVFTFEELKKLGAKLVEQREHFSEKIAELTKEETLENVDELVRILMGWDIIETDGYFPRDLYDSLDVIEIEK